MAAALKCPLCRQAPSFHGGHRTTAKRGVRCAFLVGCWHVRAMFGTTIIEAPDANAALARWNADAERAFASYTARWTDTQRTNFRRELGYPAAASVT